MLNSNVEVVIEATGNPEVGAKHAFDAIEARKHLVMVTVEADVVVGSLLKQRAVAAGVMYSLAYGDEPALAVELCDWARTLGFRVIAAGKGTRFIPEFRKATPDDVPQRPLKPMTVRSQAFHCPFCVATILDGMLRPVEMYLKSCFLIR